MQQKDYNYEITNCLTYILTVYDEIHPKRNQILQFSDHNIASGLYLFIIHKYVVKRVLGASQ